jgi:hypothetical protein
MLWLKILPRWLKLTVRPLHLELMTLWWHGRPNSIGLLPCELQLPLPVPLYVCLLGLNNDGLVN